MSKKKKCTMSTHLDSGGHPRYLDEASDRIAYLESLVSKQLELYNWCEEKVSTLATIDAIFIGASTMFLEKVIVVGPNIDPKMKIHNIGVAISLMLPLLISLGIALLHIIPKMGKASNKGRPNHRSCNGIRHFSNREHYYAMLNKISDEEICEDLARQIFGMNENIWRNQRSIKWAVILDIIGVAVFLSVLVSWVI